MSETDKSNYPEGYSTYEEIVNEMVDSVEKGVSISEIRDKAKLREQNNRKLATDIESEK